MTSDENVKHYEKMMNEYEDYNISADDYVELVASVKALRKCLKDVKKALNNDDLPLINKITACLEGK